MKKTTKQRVIWFFAVTVLIGAAVFLIPRLFRRDARTELAIVLGVKPEFLLLNLPPSEGRLPGSTFVVKGSLLPIDFTTRDDKDLIIGQPFTMDWHVTTLYSGEGSTASGPLGAMFSSSESVHMEIRAQDCRVLEMRLPILKGRLLHSQEILDQSARGNSPFVVVRAFEGRLETRLRKSGKESAKAWGDIRENAKKVSNSSPAGKARIEFRGTSEDEVVIAWTEPVVFAYEVQKADLFTTHLGALPDDVNFLPVSIGDILKTNSPSGSSKDKSAAGHPGGWSLMTVSSGYYPQVNWLRQEWNSVSADVFEEAFNSYHPASIKRIRSSASEPLTSERLLGNAGKFANQAAAEHRSLVVVYYIGHMVSGAEGNLWLAQSDVTQKSLKDAGKNPASLKSVGNNVDQLSKVANAIQAKYGDGSEGMLSVEKLYSTLEEAGIPFALVIDGCMEDQAFKDMAESVGFKFNPRYPELFYVGKSDVISGEIADFTALLDHFGQSMPSLRSANPVVLAAKPGTVALGIENPYVAGGPRLGPLAVRAKEVVTASLLGAEPPSISTVVKSLASYRGVGEITLKGSISWSDFSGFEKAGFLIRPQPESDVSIAPFSTPSGLRQAFHPNVGDIRDFVYFPNTKSFVIVANFFDLWSWNPSNIAAKKLKNEDELHSPIIGGTRAGTSYLFDAGTHELQMLNSSMSLVISNVDVGLLSAGADNSSLIVVCNGSTIGVKDPIYRVNELQVSEIDRFETVHVKDLVEWHPGVFAFTTEDASDIRVREQGKEIVLCQGLSSPSLLVADGGLIYCLSATSETLYKIQRTGSVEKVSLLKSIANTQLDRAPVVRGLALESPGVLLLSSASVILEIDVSSLSWEKLKAGS